MQRKLGREIGKPCPMRILFPNNSIEQTRNKNKYFSFPREKQLSKGSYSNKLEKLRNFCSGETKENNSNIQEILSVFVPWW
ncbi:MAG: hypothetical protein C4323_22730 [Mastigocladus sp. ERB_26_2]